MSKLGHWLKPNWYWDEGRPKKEILRIIRRNWRARQKGKNMRKKASREALRAFWKKKGWQYYPDSVIIRRWGINRRSYTYYSLSNVAVGGYVDKDEEKEFISERYI